MRSKLLALLWPDADDDQGKRVLSQALYALRRDLGNDSAIGGTQEVRLNLDEVWCDVAEFDAALARGAAEAAVTLYVGPFLDGFRLPSAPEFERWADDERAAIQHRFHDAVEELARAAEAEGAYDHAVRWWRRRAAEDPLNARVTMSMMRALAAAGDRSAALRQARLFEALVAQELEQPPDRDVVELARALRSSLVAARPSAERPCIAVLPFAILGDVNERVQADWRDGLVEEIIHALALNPRVRVAARSATMPFGSAPELSLLANTLGADYALEGTVRFRGDQARISARLLEVATGQTLWSERWDRPAHDPHGAHEEVAAKLAARIHPEHAPLVAFAPNPYGTASN